MKIAFIGAGKVGTAFGMYLKNNGFDVQGYLSRRVESSKRAAEFTNSKYFTDIKELSQFDILFITTNDDEISKVSKRLVEESVLKPNQILIHMSGASSSELLEDAKKCGCFTFSLHPLQAFADIEKAVRDLSNTVFSIEGDAEKISVIEDILKKLGNKYFKINKDQKSIYHAVACVVSNYLVTLMEYGLNLFTTIGIDKDEGYKALLPLIEGTINNIYKLGTEEALTGPIARGDAQTIRSHIKSINNICPENLELYKEMGLKTIELAQKNKLKDIHRIEELKKILNGVN